MVRQTGLEKAKWPGALEENSERVLALMALSYLSVYHGDDGMVPEAGQSTSRRCRNCGKAGRRVRACREVREASDEGYEIDI